MTLSLYLAALGAMGMMALVGRWMMSVCLLARLFSRVICEFFSEGIRGPWSEKN